MIYAYNGMPATELPDARWRKSGRSNPTGNCVEVAKLSNGEIALRNSRDPHGQALIYATPEIRTLIRATKEGAFDNPSGDRHL